MQTPDLYTNPIEYFLSAEENLMLLSENGNPLLLNVDKRSVHAGELANYLQAEVLGGKIIYPVLRNGTRITLYVYYDAEAGLRGAGMNAKATRFVCNLTGDTQILDPLLGNIVFSKGESLGQDN